jgi:glutathione S-transferase
MSLKLYYHPLASFCWKALIALYENDTPFEPRTIDLGDPAQHAELAALWPFAKFPVLHDRRRQHVIPESTIIIEYLTRHYPGRVALVPADLDAALEVRRLDRLFDTYVHMPMQKIVGDKLRPADKHDPVGVEDARSTLQTAYALLDRELGSKTYATGDSFTLADCAAAPALYYANRVAPFGQAHPNLTAYLQRLHARPAFARVFAEAQPYLALFPG